MARRSGAISVQLDEMDVKRVVWALQGVKNGARTAIMRSVNKSLTGVKTDMAKETTKVLNLTQKRVKKDISVKKANKARLSGVVSSSGRQVNLMQYKAKERKKGVSVKVLKTGGRKMIPGAFIFVGQNQNKLVGWRKKTKQNAGYIGTKRKTRSDAAYAAMPDKYRKPVEALYGPRIQDITARPEIMKKIENQAGVRLQKELAHQTEHLLRKQRGVF
jgi:small nuclear ribonucleoprotein (snRNP)-like protein